MRYRIHAFYQLQLQTIITQLHAPKEVRLRNQTGVIEKTTTTIQNRLWKEFSRSTCIRKREHRQDKLGGKISADFPREKFAFVEHYKTARLKA